MHIENLAVLMTCHNRCEKTLLCLRLLKEQKNIKINKLDIFLVDDGSTDNTKEEVLKNFPDVKIIEGSGNLFWNRGMHLAFNTSLKFEYQFYLWLNDDTFLYPNGLYDAFSAYISLPEEKKFSVIVGSTFDSEKKKISYGGYRRNSLWNPFKYEIVEPDSQLVTECDTMCGNFVLIPQITVEHTGIINPSFRHRWGDVDYGLRVKKAGGKILIIPGYVGECGFNSLSNQWENRSLSIKERLSSINSIKGLQKEDWKLYTKEHGGKLWFLFWLSPYLKIVLTSLLSKSK
jgi:GT2 family glycosyltransferase